MFRLMISFLLMFTGYAAKAQQVIDLYENNLPVARYCLDSAGLIRTEITLEPGRKDQDTLLYFYSVAELDSVRLKGAGLVAAFEEQREILWFNDWKLQAGLLYGYGITIPYAQINEGTVRDIAAIFSLDKKITDKYFQKRRVITFDSIYERIRFYPSLIEQFIVSNTILFKYELTLDAGKPVKEVFVFDGGRLQRTYFYKDGELREIVSRCSYEGDKKIYRSSRTFKRIVEQERSATGKNPGERCRDPQ